MKKTKESIKVIGLGGSGVNIINSMDVDMVEACIVINTDIDSLNNSKCHHKIHIGKNTTKGSGAGMKPCVGQKSALENKFEINEMINNSDIAILLTGLGGGTGTGALPVIAKLAKDLAVLPISIVTLPFNFEGKTRSLIAHQGLEKIRIAGSGCIVSLNHVDESDSEIGMKSLFQQLDKNMISLAQGIYTIFRRKKSHQDIEEFIKNNIVYACTAEYSGESALYKALDKALNASIQGDALKCNIFSY